jgi:hypothetical protein
MIIMEKTKGSSSEDSYLNTDIDAEASYFMYSDMTSYFPTLKVSAENAPIGSSGVYCIHLRWIKKEMAKVIDMYKHVQGFSNCTNAFNTKVRWPPGNPTHGVDF